MMVKKLPISHPLFGSRPDYAKPSVPSSAIQVAEVDDAILVIFEPDGKNVKLEANIYCYEKSGDLRWIVKPVKDDRFVSIWWDEEHGKPGAISSWGTYVVLDMKTGDWTWVDFRDR